MYVQDLLIHDTVLYMNMIFVVVRIGFLRPIVRLCPVKGFSSRKVATEWVMSYSSAALLVYQLLGIYSELASKAVVHS